ncbi:MAG TPA: hypothetical protein VKA46_33490 [Gemmataceae bacterium]|nr:hypothetical protein [Gemmataceae bacterium]
MPDTTTPTAPPTVRRDALRIVLFGMPAAGKSSLLGALGEAAKAQEHLLHGRLADLSQGLGELRQRLYEESPRRTVEEIVPYPITFEPFADEHDGGRAEGLLIDCDGRVANDLLVRRKSLEAASPEGTLAYEVLLADTLILAIDASAPPAQVDADFQEFGRFLRLLERGRGQRAEVGGLPVFLVLTKCDLLAKPNDSTLDWMEHVEERKRQVDGRFQDFLARKAAAEGPLSFGRIDLHLWATAVKRPPLADAPAKPREPYGVAELFRQCLHAARDFHRRRRHSSHRLLWTVAGAVGLVTLLAVAALWIWTRPGTSNQGAELLNKIETYESREGLTAAERLQGSPEQLAQRIAVLNEFRNDPRFGKLPPEKQEYINERLKELQEYDAYYRKLREARPPADARSLAELDKIEQGLKTTLAVPREEWGQTHAARVREGRLEDAAALRRAVKTADDWYAGLREKGEPLWTFAGRQPGTNGASIDWGAWQKDVSALLRRPESSPFRDTDSPTLRDTALRFTSVVEARAGWEATRDRLRRLLDLSAALGLGRVPDHPPLLVFSAGPFPPADARARLQELKKDYPKFEEDFTLADLPEAPRPDLRQVARTNYQNLLESGRAAVLSRLKQAGTDDRETSERWKEVRRWLLQGPDELADWRVLARVLRRLSDPDVEVLDPVDELASFLGRERFDIKLSRLRLAIPRDLGVEPQGNLTVTYEAEGKQTPLPLEPLGEGQYDAQRRVTTYTFRTTGEGGIVYRTGEALWAKLPLRKPGEAGGWAFSWIQGRSRLYEFEHLLRGAWLHREGEKPTSGKYYEDIRLVPAGDTQIPRVPDLLPVVKL